MSGDGFALSLPEELVNRLADEVADRLAAKMDPQSEPYLNVDGAAEYLACDKRRIYDLKERGAIPTYQDGKRLLFRRCDLDEYVSHLTCD